MKKIIFILFILFPMIVFAKEEVVFSGCIDGDTIRVIINNTDTKVRLLAVDTPESVSTKVDDEYYGKEASEYTCNLITKAKLIELEYDDNSDKTDKYGRTLAWVFVDSKLLQESIIRNGYGEVAYLYDDYKYTSVLKDSEILAKKEKLGIWKDEKDTNIYMVILIIIITLLYPYFRKILNNILKGSKIKLKF